MVYRGFYALVLSLHLLTVVFVIGPLAIAGVAAPRALEGGSAAAPRLRSAHRTVQRYSVASLLTPLLGTAMIGLGGIGKQWDYGDVWVSASYALYIVAVLASLLVAAPAIKGAAAALEGGSSTEVFRGRMQAAAGGAALAWLVIVVLMVWKPGA